MVFSVLQMCLSISFQVTNSKNQRMISESMITQWDGENREEEGSGYGLSGHASGKLAYRLEAQLSIMSSLPKLNGLICE